MDLKIKSGCDIVSVNRFDNVTKKDNLLTKLFTNYELTNSSSLKSLAGIFAAKEAIIKALELTTDNWHNIEIIKQNNGKPVIKINKDIITCNIISSDVSISHDGDYALAFCVFLIKNN